MKKVLYTFIAIAGLLIAQTDLVAQTINAAGADCGPDGFELTVTGVFGGKNAYSSTTDGISTVVYWSVTDSRWVIASGTVVGQGNPVWISDNNTPINPPNLAIGNWTSVFNDCEELVQFEGSGTAQPGVLPVSLTNFEGRATSKSVALTWETATETNNEGFEVQRSESGENWSTLGFVTSTANGNTASTYVYNDERPHSGRAYYRLKQIDYDGRFTFSPIVDVLYFSGGELNIFPNPAGEVINLHAPNATAGQPVVISDTNGRVVFQQPLSGTGTLDVGNLRPGIYYVRVATEAGAVSRKFVRR